MSQSTHKFLIGSNRSRDLQHPITSLHSRLLKVSCRFTSFFIPWLVSLLEKTFFNYRKEVKSVEGNITREHDSVLCIITAHKKRNGLETASRLQWSQFFSQTIFLPKRIKLTVSLFLSFPSQTINKWFIYDKKVERIKK